MKKQKREGGRWVNGRHVRKMVSMWLTEAEKLRLRRLAWDGTTVGGIRRLLAERDPRFYTLEELEEFGAPAVGEAVGDFDVD